MSLTTKQIVDEFNRPDPSSTKGECGQYVEDLYNDGPWPTEEEQRLDAERSDFHK